MKKILLISSLACCLGVLPARSIQKTSSWNNKTLSTQEAALLKRKSTKSTLVATIKSMQDLNSRLGSIPTVVKFFTLWCGYCSKMKPIFEEAAANHPEIQFLEININDAPELSKLFGVKTIPSFRFFDTTGAVIEKSSGYLNKNDFDTKLKKVFNLN